MKKIIISIITGILLCLLPAFSHAGTVMIGAKGWYSIWDSAIGKTLGEYYHSYFENAGISNSTEIDTGSGYLAGPVIGYQTEDRVWSCSIAAMLFSSFTQDSTFTAQGEKGELSMELTRKDIDISGGFSVTDFLKIFAGYKYMYTRADLKFKFNDGTEIDMNWYQSMNHAGTAGAGVSFPITDKMLISGQLGILYVKTDLEHKDGTTYDVADSWGYTAEAAFSFFVTQNILFQVGPKYQTFTLKIEDLDTSEKDQFLGVTGSVVYLW